MAGITFSLFHWGFHDYFLKPAIGEETSMPLSFALYGGAIAVVRHRQFGLARFYMLAGAGFGQVLLRSRQDSKIHQHFCRRILQNSNMILITIKFNATVTCPLACGSRPAMRPVSWCVLGQVAAALSGHHVDRDRSP